MTVHDDNHTFVGDREVTEATPLVNTEQRTAIPPVEGYQRRVILVSFALLFFTGFGASLLGPGITVVLEQKICHEIHAGLEAVDMDCKAPAVQGKLASIRGWETTMECLPVGLVATVPYGILSDKWGRHRVNTLAFIGFDLSMAFYFVVLYFDAIPVEALLAAPMPMLLGGGVTVISAMVYTSIADIFPASARARIFLQLSALLIFSDLASSPLAGLILMRSTWCLMFLAFGLFIIATVTSLFLPDTLKLAERKHDQHEILHDGGGTEPQDHHNSSPIRESILRARKSVRDIHSFLSGHRQVIILTLCFVFVALARLVQEMLLQYTTKRYNWSWSKVSAPNTFGLVLVLVLTYTKPGIVSSDHSECAKMSVVQKDVWISCITGLAGIIGALTIAFASNVPVLIIGLSVFAINVGMTAVIRSLLSSMVESRHMGTLNSLIGVLEMVGLMVAAPALFGSLRLGFEIGGNWIGLPFMLAAAMISVSTAIVWFLPIGEKERPASSSHEDAV
ncbi:hypothetical protein TruAng_011297 [Truncatella angustata]|nr:hypothetical protein TruAng_011297 [Truncatella angustata]